MKKSLLLLLLPTAIAAFAQSDQEPPTLTFDTDVYIQVPKYTLSIGNRGLSGSKASFSGFGRIQSSQDIGGLVGDGSTRSYQDGSVRPDARIVLDSAGAPVLDDAGNPIPITPDGKTNSWNYLNSSQALPNGNIAMHTYSATTQDSGPKPKDPGRAFGVEVAVQHDGGKISTHFLWNVGAGLSINDINSNLTTSERATITTVTDQYSLFGQPAPEAPYSAPSSTTTPVTDANGNAVLNDDGTPATVTTDTTTLLSSDPVSRATTTSTSDAAVTNHWHLKGAYFTMRAGPSITLPFSEHFRASVSAGAAFIYAGTTYTVQQNFQPETGNEITSTAESTRSTLLPGYYADANIEFWLTERAGIYVGAVYQKAGDYTQTIDTDTAKYSTTVDLSTLSGFRAGMNIRF
jgi:hypothetical protein